MRTTNIKGLDKMFIERWSPRAFKSEFIPKEDIDTIFEAARWSPSCYNEQPWIFCYATEKEDLKRYVSVLVDFNQTWAKTAPMLVIAFSRKNFERNNKANHWADFDTGSAWMSLCFQAEKLGYRCHAMAGFDPKKALEVVGLSAENIRPIAVIAIGKQGNKNILPEDMQKKEIQSDRKPIEQIVFEGKIS